MGIDELFEENDPDLQSLLEGLEKEVINEEENQESSTKEQVSEKDEKTEKMEEKGQKEEVEGTEEKKEKLEVEQRQVKKELEKIVELIGKDTTLKSKGLEAKVEEFKPEELQVLAQKGLRFYQAMEELAKERETLLAREKALEDALRRIEEQSKQVSTMHMESVGKKAPTEIPKQLLEISEDDTPEVVALKTYLKSLGEKVESISSFKEEVETKRQQEGLLREIKEYQEVYPLASVEETLAVHFLSGGQIPISKIMETSQKSYGSPDFVKRVFSTHPEVKKVIRDEIISEYLAEKNKAKSTSPKSSIKARSSTRMVETSEKKEPITFENVSNRVLNLVNELDENK